ncbi:MAG: hypothetical protein D6732_03085, partial [Methanobacteriota archaeon]
DISGVTPTFNAGHFIKFSQDDGSQIFRAMDDVFYVLGSIYNFLEVGEPIFVDQIANLTEAGNEFLRSAYENGHWANWKGSRPSMESTFQAISLFALIEYPNWFNKTEAQKVIDFLNLLKTSEGGFFPLLNWDVPDVTSTYRALQISKWLNDHFGSFERQLNTTGVDDYLRGNYVEPVFITSGSGYSEVTNGTAELLASYYAFASFVLLNQTDPYLTNVVRFISTLTSPNGGVAGYIGGLPRTGFSVRAIEYYLLVRENAPNLLGEFPTDFLENAFNYIIGNQEPNSGFLSSSNDASPNIESTFFSIRIIANLQKLGLLPHTVDLSGALEFVLFPPTPTYGFGDYPSDVPTMIHTAQAVLASRLLENNSIIDPQVRKFLEDAFSTDDGGFGIRPGASARIKYTFYGILALRALGDPLLNHQEMVSFVEKSEVETGGIGQFPGAKLAYITHTYWGMSILKLLDAFETSSFNRTNLKNFLLRQQDPNTGFFKNSPLSSPSVISTFRATRLLLWLGYQVNSTRILQTLEQYRKPSGGYVNTLDRTQPTMEATYHAVALQKMLNASIDWESVLSFVDFLKNEDGGYGLRPGFTSRVSSTFFALRLIYEATEGERSNQDVEGGLPDVFSPLITQSFIPDLDNYKQFSGTYVVRAKIIDPESHIAAQYVEINWYSATVNRSMTINGTYDENGLFKYELGTFKEKGLVEFRIVAFDDSGNIAKTEWFYLVSIGISEGASQIQRNWIEFGIRVIPYLLTLVGMTDAITKYSRSRTYSKEEIKIMYTPKSKGNWTDTEIFNTFIVIMLMIGLATIGRLFLFEATFVLERSLFLFRFLLAIILILFTKYSLGLETYGLFAPSVLVISMIQIGPFWGTILFLNIFTLLYLVRVLISPYGFPVGFRIGIMMVFNITYLGVMELLGEIYRIPFLSSALFVPIIILPWITDRYVGNVEQNDHYMAFTRLLASLVVTWGAYYLMSNDTWVRFVALTPEIWVLLVAIILFYGRGRKYTFMDTRRFMRLFKKGEQPLSILIRNRNYIAKYNPPEVFQLINKFDMKLQFEKWNVPTPDLYGIVTEMREIPAIMERLVKESLFENGFVIKPTQSLGGMGIIVVQKRDERGNFLIGGETYAPQAISNEIQRIVQGEYLSTQTLAENDICIIEEKIVVDDFMAEISTGLPDIRVIVFRGVPVMAMARLPTSESDGKANLKQGAIGAGVDMETGEIFHAEWKQHPVEMHPDTRSRIIGRKIPYWKQILAVACLAQKSSGLGYAGVDIVLGKRGDETQIYVLEINKRPGLEIQNINQASLLNRLDFIEELAIDYRLKSPLACASMGIKLGKVWKEKDWQGTIKMLKQEDEQ